MKYETLYTYDARGNVLTVTPTPVAGTTQQLARTFTYNGTGELVTALQPESGLTQFEYNLNGGMSKKTDARQQIVRFAYDNADRLTTKTYESSEGIASAITPSATWTYYGVGVMCTGTTINCTGLLQEAETVGTVTGANGFTWRKEFAYDAKGRTTESKQTTSGSWGGALVTGLVKYAYNGADQVEELTYPSGRVVRSCGNTAGQLESVTGLTTGGMTARSYATGGQYEADGGLKEITIGALKETRTYNGTRQVESIALAKGAAGVWNLTNYYCGFDANVLDCAANNGNVMKQVLQQPKPPGDGGGSQQFQIKYGYDAVNRLTSAQEELTTNPAVSSWGQTFGYDQYGNRWVTGMIPDMPNGTPNSPQWVNAKNQLEGIGTQYDAAGNLTLLGTGSHAFQWDVEGRKVEDAIVSAGSTYRTWYAYDADGRRVRKQNSDGTWTVFVYDARGKVVAEFESGDGPTTELNYVYQDHLGSTRLVADTGGVPRKRYDYMPFGEEVGLWNGRSGIEYGGIGGVSQRFTGKERDEGLLEATMDNFGARYFSGAMGRFTSADPLLNSGRPDNPQSWNRYAYGFNNPLRFTDPTGLFNWDSSLGGDASEEQLRKTMAKKEANRIITQRKNITSALNKMAKSGDSALSGVASAYGSAGDNNGVTIAAGPVTPGAAAQAANAVPLGYDSRGNTEVTVPENASGNGLFISLAHEGAHVQDAQNIGTFGSSGNVSMTRYETEMHGYMLTMSAARYLGLPGASATVGSTTFQFWNPSWTKTDLQTQPRQNIDRFLNASPMYNNPARNKRLTDYVYQSGRGGN